MYFLNLSVSVCFPLTPDCLLTANILLPSNGTSFAPLVIFDLMPALFSRGTCAATAVTIVFRDCLDNASSRRVLSLLKALLSCCSSAASVGVVTHGQWAHLDKLRLALIDRSAQLVEPSLCLVSLLRHGDTCAYSFFLMSSSTSRSNAALTPPLRAAIPNGTARLPLVVLSSPPVQSSSDLSRPER